MGSLLLSKTRLKRMSGACRTTYLVNSITSILFVLLFPLLQSPSKMFLLVSFWVLHHKPICIGSLPKSCLIAISCILEWLIRILFDVIIMFWFHLWGLRCVELILIIRASLLVDGYSLLLACLDIRSINLIYQSFNFISPCLLKLKRRLLFQICILHLNLEIRSFIIELNPTVSDTFQNLSGVTFILHKIIILVLLWYYIHLLWPPNALSAISIHHIRWRYWGYVSIQV